MTKSRKKPRSWTLRLALVAGSSLICLVLAELGLRLLRGEQFYPYFPESARQFFPEEAVTPGVTGVSNFTTNSYGTRGREPRGDETLRILTIGGSTTACTILDDSETWPHMLEVYMDEATKQAGKKSTWVANSGIDGLHTDHHLMHVKFLLPRLPSIDYVLIHAGINDMGMWFHNKEFDPNYLADPDHWNGRIGEAFRLSHYTPEDWPVYKRLALWKVLSQAKDAILTRRAKEQQRAIVQDAELRWLDDERKRRARFVTEQLPEGKTKTLPIALETYEKALQSLVDETRKKGAEPMLMTQALQSKFVSETERKRLWMGAVDGGESYVSEDDYPVYMDMFNERMRRVATRSGVLLIDLAKAREWDGTQFYDGMHFSEEGARTVARFVVKCMVEHGALKKVGGK